MKAYPKIGTRVIVTYGEYMGRQGRTEKTEGGRGRIELTLLGGVFKLGVSVPLEHVEKSREPVQKLPPRRLLVGDRLYSLTGLTWPIGRIMTIKEHTGLGEYRVESEYGQMHTLKPTLGFERRWAIIDGTPLLPPEKT